MIWTPHVLPTIVGFFIAIAVAAYTLLIGLDRRANRLFFMLVVMASLWTLIHVFEVLESDLEQRMIWVYLQYFAVNLVPLLYFFLAAEVTGNSRLLRLPIVLTALSSYLAISVAIPLDSIHHLFYIKGSIGIESTPAGNALVFEPGPLFWLQIAFCYALMIGGFGQYTLALFGGITPMLRRQVGVLLGASLIPFVANMAYVFNPLHRLARLDLTPVAIAVTLLVFALAISRYKLLAVTPPVTRQVLAQWPDPLLFFDVRAELMDLNPAAERLLGLSSQQAMGQRLGELISIEGALRVDAEHTRLIEQDVRAVLSGEQAAAQREIDLEAGEGRRRALRISVFGLRRQGAQRPEGAALRVFDISAARQAARQREALLAISLSINGAADVVTLCSSVVDKISAILEVPIVGIWLHEPREGRLRLVASTGMTDQLREKIALQSLTPGSPGIAAETARRRAVMLIDDAARHPLLAYAGDEAARNQSRNMVSAPLCVGDELIGVLQLVSRTLRAFGEEEQQTVSLAANQLAMGINRIRLLEEYTSASLSLELQTQRAVEANLMQERFLSNMSHALRTPMNSILGFAKILQRGHYGAIPDEITEPLEIIRRSGEGLMRVINDVMELGRIDSKRIELHCELIHCREPLDDYIAELYPEASQAEVELVNSVEEHCLAWTDPEYFRQIVLNLVRSLIGFAAGGAITISAIATNDLTTFRIGSSVGGVPGGLAQYAFDLFAQIEHADLKPYVGSGLSLPLARGLVELHGGEIRLERGPSGISIVVFDLPRVSAPATR